MTTYYHYHSDGKVTTSSINPAAKPFTPCLLNADVYEQKGDVVGAFLARRNMIYPAKGVPEVHGFNGPSYDSCMAASDGGVGGGTVNQSHRSSDEDEDSGYTVSSPNDATNTLGWAGWASNSNMLRPYPNPEAIRHLHTLQSLLPYLQPERKLNALNGPVVDIVEQDTGNVFAYQVPKKMLVLFLGRRVVNKFLRTIHREDDENWHGLPICQEMNLPRGVSSRAAVKSLVAWMFRACQYQTMGSMMQIRIPKTTFVACSLARTMELFGLHKDALRVDQSIAHYHFARPIFATELATLWNLLGAEDRYVYAAIKVVGHRLHAFENDGTGRETMGIDDEMLAMLKEYPELEARVRDWDLNEKHQPHFSTKWMKRLVDQKDDRQEQTLNELRRDSNPRSSKSLQGDQPAKQSEEEPRPVDLKTTTGRFAVLRIVPETAKSAASDT
jgi:hypothetical protein